MCGALLAGVAAALALVRSPMVADALLWRLDRWSGAPTLSQRVFERQLSRHHLVQDRLLPAGSALVFGDSHLQALPFSAWAGIHNFALGGETAQRLAVRLPQFRSLAQARAVVLGTGTNDLREGRSADGVLHAWRQLLGDVPPAVAVVCVGMPLNRAVPAMAQQVGAINQRVADLCRARSAIFVPVVPGEGRFSGASFMADGVHLDAAGSLELSYAIAQALEELSKQHRTPS